MSRRTTGRPPVLPGFTYIRPLGSGGFADVFLYEQDMPRRIVAVKVLIDDAINPEVLRTFNAEADILARLSTHPTIVTIFQASISADGRPYFAMEYCPDTMSARYKKAPVSLPEGLSTGVRIASALESAHRSGVLHRDIKPSNILLTTMGLPVLADFGIASALLKADDAPEVFAMSVPWSSPEVVQERTTGTVASEVWSLGATLYTLLAGRGPFDATDGSKKPRDRLIKDIVGAPYQPIGGAMPPRLDAALARCLEKDPARRFTSMLEFAEELRWVQYEVGVPPTALEIASQEWASASGAFDGSDASARGPVITTVKAESRRAARAQELASLDRRRRDSHAEVKTPKGSSKRPALIGGIVGAAVVAIITVAALAVAGII